MREIPIRCTGSGVVALDALIAFQGDLKTLSVENYERLKKVVLELGFSEPISVWKHPDGGWRVLNGHQRLNVLKGLREEGYHIPPVPVSEVVATDEAEAKKKVLTLTSQYGEITDDGLYEFLTMSGTDWEWAKNSLRLPEIDLLQFEAGFFTDTIDMPSIPSEAKEPFREATFTVHDDQWTTIERALAQAKKNGLGQSQLNANSNGNALTAICRIYLGEEISDEQIS